MRVTSWSFGGNSLPQFRSGTVTFYDDPLWLSIWGWIIDNIIRYGCWLFHWIKLPKSIYITDEGIKYSLREWWGDVGELYHIYIYGKLWTWYCCHPSRKIVDIEVGYDKLKEMFGEHNPEYFLEQDKFCEEYIEKTKGI
jgi:hypothetical protein